MHIETARRLSVCAQALLFIAALNFFSCTGGGNEKEPRGTVREEEAVRDEEAPYGFADSTIVLRSLSGESIRMSELRGEIVVLNFWATWNNESVKILPMMDRFAQRYRRYRFFAVATDEGGARTVRSFVATHPVAMEVIVNGGEVARSFGGVRKLPVTIVLLRDGRVLRRFDGLHRSDKYDVVLSGIIRRRL